MDATISTTCGFTFSLNGTVKDTWPSKTSTVPVTGNDSTGGTIEASTDPKGLPMSEVTPGGICAFHNLSKVAAEVIHIRRQSEGSNVLTLKPGETFVVRLGFDSAPKIVSEEGTPLLRFFMADD